MECCCHPSRAESLSTVRLATIDLGTNTALLLVAEADALGRLHPVHEEERFVRLGEGVDATRRLAEAAMARAIAVLADYAATAQALGAPVVAAAATSATRDATNRETFRARVREATGLALEVLSGDEEALWSFRGACSAFPELPAACVLDVGGGSTELVAGTTTGAPPRRLSLDVGAVRLRERHFPTVPPPAEAVARAEAMVDDLLARTDGLGVGLPLVGAAGTVTALAHLVAPEDPGRPLAAATVRAWRDRLLALAPEEVAALDPPRLAGRADVFAAGVLIVDAVLRHLGADALRPSPRGLRHGLALRWLAATGHR